MNSQNLTPGVRELIHDAIDRTTTAVQNIHLAIAKAPVEALATSDNLAEPARDLGEAHESVVGFVYDTVRDINREIQQLGDDLLR